MLKQNVEMRGNKCGKEAYRSAPCPLNPEGSFNLVEGFSSNTSSKIRKGTGPRRGGRGGGVLHQNAKNDLEEMWARDIIALYPCR